MVSYWFEGRDLLLAVRYETLLGVVDGHAGILPVVQAGCVGVLLHPLEGAVSGAEIQNCGLVIG